MASFCFDGTWWPQFNGELQDAIAISDSPTNRVRRDDREILEEVLESVRSLNSLLAEGKPSERGSPDDTNRILKAIATIRDQKVVQQVSSPAEEIFEALLQHVRTTRPLIQQYFASPKPILVKDVLFLCFSEGHDMALETAARPNNRKFAEEFVRQYDVRLKVIREANLLNELREIWTDETSGSSTVT